jgi:hypothetical protein
MTDERRDALIRHPSVPIAAAAELTDVDVPTVREWARAGSLVIEQRGDMEVVDLARVTHSPRGVGLLGTVHSVTGFGRKMERFRCWAHS